MLTTEPADAVEGLKRVLLVEDDPRLLRALERALRVKGHALHCASTAEDAFRELRSHAFDTVVADYELGDSTGDLVLRAAAGLRRPPFRILISGRHPPAQRLRDGGVFDAFFVKPFAIGAIIELLESPHARN